VRDGRGVSVALRHLDSHRSDPEAVELANALARFLVDRCQTQHTGWRTVRRIVEESSENPPWERCARRAVTQITADLMLDPHNGRATRLGPARQLAAQRQAEEIAPHVDSAVLLGDLGLRTRDVPADSWRAALASAVGGRSRQQVAQRLDSALGTRG
jgi:hypothetical protein